MKKLKRTQIFTPPEVTNEMIDLLVEDQPGLLSDWETFVFEPTCGDGQMLAVILERVYSALLRKYEDKEKALCETLFKFYATELDESLIPKARMRIFAWAQRTAGRELTNIEQLLIALQLHQAIECRDALKDSIPNIHPTPGMRALKRKSRNVY